MTHASSSIDDVLATAHLPPEQRKQHPTSPEQTSSDDYKAVDQKDTNVVPIKTEVEKPVEVAKEEKEKPVVEKPKVENEQKTKTQERYDDYGNEKHDSASKTYTEEEVNERINKTVRERLERLERSKAIPQPQAPIPQQLEQQAAFNYDPNSQQDWQMQLEQFVRQTNEKINRETVQKTQQAQEQRAHQEFEAKFHQGMSKFHDFVDVVSTQPFSDAMTMATRGMKDPASFVYAAAKRHGTEIQRISQINDPYVQMVEIGKLEERMRKTQAATNAPKPVRTMKEDSTVDEPETKTKSIEDLMREADARKLAARRRPRN